jgi:hypothetical protein
MRIIHWRMGFFSAVMLVCDDGSARAEDRAILIPGKNPSCGSYTTGRATQQSQRLEDWVIGFLSGVNVGLGSLSGVNVAGNADTEFLKGVVGEAIWAWLDNYCRDHPLDLFQDAVAVLVRELVSRRSQHK